MLIGPAKLPFWICVPIALVYAMWLSSIDGEMIIDRHNYFDYATTSWTYLDIYKSGGLLKVLFNEPIWLIINGVLSNFLHPLATMKSIIFVSSFTTAFLVARYDRRISVWMVLFLLYPGVLSNNLIHLRQGLAAAIFLAGWFTHKNWLILITLIIASFIHSSFFVVMAIWGVGVVSYRVVGDSIGRLIIYAFAAVFLAVSLGFIAGLVGARQGEVAELGARDISGLGFVFWLCILALLLSQGEHFIKHFSFQIAVVIFYLVSYFITPFSARVLSSALIPVFLSGLYMESNRKGLFVAAIIVFTILSYVLRRDMPMFGFGLEYIPE